MTILRKTVYLSIMGLTILVSGCDSEEQKKEAQTMQKSQSVVQKNQEKTIKVATFDSGFGGYFTAKAIEQSADSLGQSYNARFSISHFGDTANLPYGEKTPEQIANLTASGVLRALKGGANMVFIACNTASTQYEAVKKAVDAEYPNRSKDVFSVIEVSAMDAKRQIDDRLKTQDEVNFAIMATPATLKAGAYPRAIAKLYGQDLKDVPLTPITQPRWFKEKGATIDNYTGMVSLKVDGGKTVNIYQLAAANWVDLIEQGGNQDDKKKIVAQDLAYLDDLVPQGKKLDGVGEFCTHYPVFDGMIQSHLKEKGTAKDNAFFITQGHLMADLFEKRIEQDLKGQDRKTPLTEAEKAELIKEQRPTLTISGDNVDATEKLVRTVFPNDPAPKVEQFKPQAQPIPETEKQPEPAMAH